MGLSWTDIENDHVKIIIKMPYDLNDDLDLKFTDLFSV